MFSEFIQLGWQHILDLNGLDHLLFLLVLCAPYSTNQWRQVLVLITAFTLGHSLTLLISTLNIFTLSSQVVEFLIPLTIIITAIENIVLKNDRSLRVLLNYFMVAFFGLIHGLAFSNDIRPMLEGTDELLTDLLAFNLGIEIGQIIVVACIFAFLALFTRVFKTKQQNLNLILSGGAAVAALVILFKNIF